VLPTGEIIKTGVETAKGVVGYDLTRLLVGSEGTLGVITDITLRLIPKPEAKKTMLAFFRDAPAAVTTVSNIIRSKIVPTTLEFMDRVAMDAVREDFRRPVPKEAGALLLIEVDGDAGVVKKEADQIKTQCLQDGAVRFEEASSLEETRDLWSARREVSPALRKLKPGKISEDIVVPRNLMARLVDFLHQLGTKYGLPVASYGHAGDGNLHANILLDDRVPEEKEKAEKAVRELFEKVIALRGTISGEHGIGLTKAPYIEMELSRHTLDLMSRIKQAFDPNNILNPGKIFP
jgi:glycolate oxidase